jgi:hypothetical protein
MTADRRDRRPTTSRHPYRSFAARRRRALLTTCATERPILVNAPLSKLLQTVAPRAPAASEALTQPWRRSVRAPRRQKNTRRRNRCCAPCGVTAEVPYDCARCCCICLRSSVLSSQALHGAVRSLRAVKVRLQALHESCVCVAHACHRVPCSWKILPAWPNADEQAGGSIW